MDSMCIVKSVRARILLARVADNAVVDLALHLFASHTRVSQAKAVAQPAVMFGPGQGLGQVGPRLIDLDQVFEIKLIRPDKRHPAADLGAPLRIGVYLYAPF